ncbi:HVA22-like protein j [Linum grandiflorum]
MLGDFLNRLLLLFFGYAYPAFECFKVAEKNKINIEDIRFWCQYWIIVALITVCERIVDMFLWWLPFYGEAKLGFFIWLWYPKTKGTCFVFNNFVRPYVSKHETDIDQKLHEVKARVWDFAIYYWQNCAKLGQSTFFQVLEQLATQSGRFGNNNVSKPQVQLQLHTLRFDSVCRKLLRRNLISPARPKNAQNFINSPPAFGTRTKLSDFDE